MNKREKIFNWLSIIGGAIGGVIASLLGGIDKLIIALLILMVLDYITGVLKGLYNKKLSSEIGFKGLLKKILILIVVAVGVIVQEHLGVPVVREAVIMFFAVNETLSILENAGAMGLPLPPKLKDALLQLRDKDKKESEEK